MYDMLGLVLIGVPTTGGGWWWRESKVSIHPYATRKVKTQPKKGRFLSLFGL